MRNSDALRDEADRHRLAFSKSASLAAEHLKPRRLIEDALQMVDPNFRFLNSIENSLQRNPIALMGVIAGLWIIFHRVANRNSIGMSENKKIKTNAPKLEN